MRTLHAHAHNHTLSLSHTHSLSHTLSLSLTHSRSLTHTHSLSLSHTLSLSLTHSLSHTHTLSLTRTHTQLNRVAIGYTLGGARILDYCIQHGSLDLNAIIQDLKNPDRSYKYETDDQVARDIEKAITSTKSHKDAVQEFGLACGRLLI